MLAPLLLLGASTWIAWETAWRTAEQEAVRAADATAEYARRVLEGLLLQADRANEILRGASEEEIRANELRYHERLAALPIRMDDPGGFRLIVHDREGRPLVSGTAYPAAPGERISPNGEDRAPMPSADGPTVHGSRVHAGAEAGRAFLTVSRPRDGTGDSLTPGERGVIDASVDLASLGTRLQRQMLDHEDAVSLLRSDGVVLVRVTGLGLVTPDRVSLSAALIARMQRGEETVMMAGRSTIDGAWRAVAIRRISGWPVYAAVARSHGAIVATWWQAVLPQIALGIACTTLLLLLALTVRRREAALVVANGSLERRVAERTAALAASEAEFRATFEESPIGKMRLDVATGRFLRVNPAFCALTGYGEEELVRGMHPVDLTHPEDRAPTEAQFRTLVETGRRVRFETRAIRRDGELIWIEISAGLIRDPLGGPPANILATVQDVTDRKQAEERLLLLAREVDHRAKNALAVVQAAMRLAPRSDPEAFMRAVEGRIAALARAQVMLSDANWRGADLRTLATHALSPFLSLPGAGGSGSAVRLDGPPVFLAATAVQPVTLMLHELATNASKYGALSREGGEVSLDWQRDDAAGELRLAWRESGGPPVTPPQRRGFGSRVLEATAQDQLGGRVLRQWNADGLVCEIALPLERALGGVTPRMGQGLPAPIGTPGAVLTRSRAYRLATARSQ